MKLLFDQNTSPSLARNLDDLFPGSNHVYNLQMHERPDAEVWEFARRNDFIVLTKDVDFSEISMKKGFPPKLLWLRIGNCRTVHIEQLLRQHYDVIREFVADPERGVLSLFGRGAG